MILEICVKCSDQFFTSIEEKNGQLVGTYSGYVPEFFPGEHYGDYVELKIDTDTGKILNWKKPSKKAIMALLEKSK